MKFVFQKSKTAISTLESKLRMYSIQFRGLSPSDFDEILGLDGNLLRTLFTFLHFSF